MMETAGSREQYSQASLLKQGFDKIHDSFLNNLLEEYGSVNPTVDFTATESKKMTDDLSFIRKKINEYSNKKLLDSHAIDFLNRKTNRAESSRDNILIIALLETFKEIEGGTLFQGLMLQ